MEKCLSQDVRKPRIIIHGGAGDLTRDNTPPDLYKQYSKVMLDIVQTANRMLYSGGHALDVAAYAVRQMESNALFNSAHGAVFTRAGTHELEASVMVSRGHHKRGAGVMQVRTTKHPIDLARELLVQGDKEDGGGALGHVQITGPTCDQLARDWGIAQVKPSYFWTRKSWNEHRRGLDLEYDDAAYERHKAAADEVPDRQVSGDFVPSRPEAILRTSDDSYVIIHHESVPQGTVGAVVLDTFGTLCTATSTGGRTNKLPGRIGDTATLGAGFWAEEWADGDRTSASASKMRDWLPAMITGNAKADDDTCQPLRAVALSGTGNGDSFLRINAVRTVAAIARFATKSEYLVGRSGEVSLQQAVTAVAGPGGLLERSVGERFYHADLEGHGGIIGIELKDGVGQIVWDLNTGGMHHAWVDDEGEAQYALYKDESKPPRV